MDHPSTKLEILFYNWRNVNRNPLTKMRQRGLLKRRKQERINKRIGRLHNTK